MRKIYLSVVAGLVALGGVLALTQNIAAASGSLYVSPSSSSVLKGNTVTVSVRINPGGTGVDGVETSLSYDSSKLQYTSINATGSGFEIALGPQTGGGGSVSITRGTLSGQKTADTLVAKVSFKALVGSGTTPIGITGNATSAGDYTDPTKTGASIKLTSPTPKPPVDDDDDEPTNNPPSNNDDDNPSTPNTSNDPNNSTSKPKSTSVSATVQNKTIQFNSARISVKTSKAAQVYIRYGTDKYEFQTPLTKLGKSHNIAISSKTLLPGTTYQYRVVTRSSTGKTTESAVETFTTKGYSVNITVYGKDKKLLKNEKLTIFSTPQDGQTNDQGVVTFANLAPGDHTLKYEQGGKTYEQPVKIDDNVVTAANGTQTAALQNASVTFSDADASGVSVWIWISAGIVLLAVLAVAVVALAKRQGGQKLTIGATPFTVPEAGAAFGSNSPPPLPHQSHVPPTVDSQASKGQNDENK